MNTLHTISRWLQKHYLVVLVILVLGVAFYWFQLRPAQIRNHCAWVNRDGYSSRNYDFCIHYYGI